MEEHATRWNCIYCNHKNQQLEAAVKSGNEVLIADLSASLQAHLGRSHVPEAIEQ